ncbi:hypothetical protein FHG64_03180 [Antarcticibacterium flavum]|uniref:Two pore domain potassium channel family protein n=1 Tax=Antarcticibacterium flavum TaxID=2058175 RepID=A0A5B7X1B2_9FLAO|nr:MULTISPECIES: hypothetical protein [Antarcticibacterium]MCM4158613.1 hypothetical protein [Antarcticibacterium sp. W02-3]QCY68468.1 hypothetical protein FHG64_03180 [Antarcticibacterium flavum]
MTETIYLIIGSLLLLLGIYDFFLTTLSASGAGFITRAVAFSTHAVIRKLKGPTGRGIFNISGLLVNLSVLAVWIFLVWLGLFLVFSFDPDGMTNDTGRVANWIERLYYTGYTLSTLGVGNFKTTTAFFEIITSIFSFFGFIFFTSSMTYLISVSSAVINKRTLSRSIQNLGKDPQEIADKLNSLDSSYSIQQLQSFQEMVDRHAVNHQAYPVVHFFSHKRQDVCLGLNLVRLDEALNILFSTPKDNLTIELQPLRAAVTHFIYHVNQNYSRSLPKGQAGDAKKALSYEVTAINENELAKRREILGGLLQNEGFEWRDVMEGRDPFETRT